MHPNKFFEEVTFSSIDSWMGGYEVTEEINEMMKEIHPSQIVSSRVKIPLFEIEYEYDNEGEEWSN